MGGLAQRAAVATLSMSETERRVEVAPLAGPMVMRTVVLTGVRLGAASQGHTSWFCTHANCDASAKGDEADLHLHSKSLWLSRTISHKAHMVKQTLPTLDLMCMCRRDAENHPIASITVLPLCEPPDPTSREEEMLVAMRSRNFEPSQNRVSLPAP